VLRRKPTAVIATGLVALALTVMWWWMGFDEGGAREPPLPGTPSEPAAALNHAHTDGSSKDVSLPVIENPSERAIPIPDAPRLQLTALDEQSQPVPRATVVFVNDPERQPLGMTDGSGVCLLDLGNSTEVGLLVSADGYLPALVAAEIVAAAARRSDGLAVQLVRDLRLRGRVVHGDGIAVGEGVTVLAWPARSPPGRIILQQVLAASGDASDDANIDAPQSEAQVPLPTDTVLLITRTDRAGAFELAVPSSDELYVLLAGGPGLVAEEPVPTRPAWEQPLELTVLDHFALAVQLVDESGATIPVSLSSPMGTHPTVGFPANAAFDVADPEWREQALLGAGIPEAREQGVWVLQFVTKRPAASVGSVRFNAVAPGFLKQSVDLEIPSTSEGLQVRTIALQRSGEQTGSLELVVNGWVETMEGLHLRECNLDKFMLVDRITRRAQTCALRPSHGDRLVIEGFAFGQYQARLQLAGGYGTRYSPEPVVIGPQMATVTFDLEDLGAIDVRIVDDTGRDFMGRAQFIVQRVDSHVGATYAFDSGPYRANFLKPALYVVTLDYAQDGMVDHPAAGRSAPVEVRAGQRAQVDLVLFKEG